MGSSVLPGIIVHLQEYNEISNVFEVPLAAVKEYSDLEALALSEFGKPESEYDVHFHLRGSTCITGVRGMIPKHWTEGFFFSEAYLEQNAVLTVSAHFVAKTIGGRGGETTYVKRENHMNAFHITDDDQYSPHGILLQGASGVKSNALGQSYRPLRQITGNKRKRYDDDMIVVGNMGFTRNQMTRKAPVFDEAIHQRLPSTATPDTWQNEYDYLMDHPVEEPDLEGCYRHNWAELGRDVQRRITQARLMQGQYGIDAPNPCKTCKRLGLQCRVYHPDIYADLGFKAKFNNCYTYANMVAMISAMPSL
ncbi:hypothetical protein B0J11DRAFT_504722 [Dendryphion nanum]|uniref:Uncharacterized protein n=1 Tax=Dendryphion nanum TaxID=256645 RepID=A0A9P9IMR5_9PLEO|nr:hypothetical protein B0J11DRAFT_504722 [Dendryphion nanum]